MAPRPERRTRVRRRSMTQFLDFATDCAPRHTAAVTSDACGRLGHRYSPAASASAVGRLRLDAGGLGGGRRGFSGGVGGGDGDADWVSLVGPRRCVCGGGGAWDVGASV